MTATQLLNRVLSVIAGMSLAPPIAWAALVIQQIPTGNQTTLLPDHTTFGLTWRQTDSSLINFPVSPFDASLGTLTDVFIGYYGSGDTRFDGQLVVPIPSTFAPAGINANMHLTLSASLPGISTPLTTDLSFNGGTTLANVGENLITIDPTGQSYDTGFASISSANFSLYKGAGTFNIPMQIAFIQEATVSPAQGMHSRFTAGWDVNLAVIYQYEPVPEPAQIGLSAAVALLIFAAVRHLVPNIRARQ